MKTIKKTLSVLLCALMVVTLFPLGAFAADGKTAASASLYAFYGDGMVFQQKKDALLAGRAAKGSIIECVLTDDDGKKTASGKTVVGDDGTFEVGFVAPSGGFEEYEISVTENGTEFAHLKGVVFGELWLASGQSNMQYNLNISSSWQEVVDNGYGNKWIRFMYGPDFPRIEGKGSSYTPNEKQDNYLGCRWINASDPDVGQVSAVGYFFAEELFEEINMPVGVLAVYLGGSPIRSWISRETLEGSADAMKILKNHDQYISSEKWDPAKNAVYDMAGNYNLKIYPLRHFRPTGVIWYQGETEILTSYVYGEYSTLFDLMQKDLTETFSYTGGSVPIVYTQLASFNYRMDDRDLQSYNAEFADIRNKSPESRAVTTVYDVPLDFVLEWGSIHPSVKEPIGRRLAHSAAGLVYGKNNAYSAPYIKKTVISGSDIFVTLDNVGDGLVSTSEELYDFAICGSDGVYYRADAELVSPDTVRIHNDNIPEPKSATYAFSQVNCRASLWSTLNGEKVMPASPFITDRSAAKELYYADTPWADCEQEKQFRSGSKDKYVGFFDLWETDGCSYEISSDSAYKGVGGLKVSAADRNFSLKEIFVFNVKDEETGRKKSINFNETSRKWSKYGALKFAVRNTGTEDIVFDGAKIKIKGTWVAPEVNGSDRIKCTVPADGEWHVIELDLNKLYLCGNTLSFGMRNIVLQEVYELELMFEGSENETAAIDVDAFEFTPKAEEHPSNGISIFVRIKDFFDLLKNMFSSLLGSCR